MLRRMLLAASDSDRTRQLITSAPVTRGIVARYVAGDTAEQALQVTRGLLNSGLLVTLDESLHQLLIGLGTSRGCTQEGRSRFHRRTVPLPRAPGPGPTRATPASITTARGGPGALPEVDSP